MVQNHKGGKWKGVKWKVSPFTRCKEVRREDVEKCHPDSSKGSPLLRGMFLLAFLAWDAQGNLRNMRRR